MSSESEATTAPVFHRRYMYAQGQTPRIIETQEELDGLGEEWFDHPPTEKDILARNKKKDKKDDKDKKE